MPLLLAMKATHNLLPNAASDGAALLDWPCTCVFPDQCVPSVEEHTSTSLLLLLAMNATHSLPPKTASDGAALLD